MSRSNASARQRRAGGEQQQYQQQQYSQKMTPQQQQVMPKLSISDAIALITLRLGRIENIIQNMPMNGEGDFSIDGDNGAIFMNMMERIDTIEKQQQFQLQQQQENLQESSEIETEVNIPQEAIDTITYLNNEVAQMKSEMNQFKEMILKMHHQIQQQPTNYPNFGYSNMINQLQLPLPLSNNYQNTFLQQPQNPNPISNYPNPHNPNPNSNYSNSFFQTQLLQQPDLQQQHQQHTMFNPFAPSFTQELEQGLSQGSQGLPQGLEQAQEEQPNLGMIASETLQEDSGDVGIKEVTE
jgi:hypothetical protein